MQNYPFFPYPAYLPYAYNYYCMMAESMMHQANKYANFGEIKLQEIQKQKQSLTQNSNIGEKNERKCRRTNKEMKKDDDWCPEYKRKKRRDVNAMTQKQDRNAVSNIIRCFLKFLSTKEAVQELQRLKQSYNSSVNMTDILRQLEKANVNHRNYVRMRSIINIIRPEGKDSLEIGKIFVMLFRIYAKSSLRIHFLTSSKLKQNNRMVVLAKIREIQRNLVDILSEKGII